MAMTGKCPCKVTATWFKMIMPEKLHSGSNRISILIGSIAIRNQLHKLWPSFLREEKQKLKKWETQPPATKGQEKTTAAIYELKKYNIFHQDSRAYSFSSRLLSSY